MDSFVMFKDLKSNILAEEDHISLYTIYCSRNTHSIVKMINLDIESLGKLKFTVLLFALLWEETSLINSLYKVFSKDYEIQIGFKNPKIISQFYSKNYIKIYEKAFLECMNNQEYGLIKEIYSSNVSFIAFTENFLIQNLRKIPFNNLQELKTLQIKFFSQPSLIWLNKGSKCLELDNFQLLRLMCKANFSEISLYTFAIGHCPIHKSISIFIKEKQNRLAQILINTYYEELVDKVGRFFKIAAKFQNFKLILYNFRSLIYSYPYDSDIRKMISYLINYLKESTEFIDLIITIFTIKFSKLNYSLCKEILIILNSKLLSKDKDCTIFLLVANPIKTLLMIFNLINIIKEKYLGLSGLSEDLLTALKEKCLKILESITNFSEIVSILDDRLLSGEKTMDLICKFKLYELMKNPLFQLYINQQWDCSEHNSISLFDISSVRKFFSNEFITNPIQDWETYIHIPNKYLKGSFIDYIRNPNTKYFYSLFFDFIIILVLLILVMQFNNLWGNILSELSSYNVQEDLESNFY